MSGFDRYNSVLRLFDEQTCIWTVPQISAELGVPQSTVYRTVRELVHVNFLEPAPDAHYRLGTAFIEYDRLLRVTDPFLLQGSAQLDKIVQNAELPCVGLFSRLYNGRVMCIADQPSEQLTFSSSYERGRPMPLMRGATSKVILSSLPTRQLNRLLKNLSPQQLAELPMEFEAFRKHLSDIRKAGYSVTSSEIDKGLVGIAAPIVLPGHDITASLSLVLEERSLDEDHKKRLILLVVSACALLRQEMEATALESAE